MTEAEPITATQYIHHHITYMTVGEGFWAVNWDTIAVSVVLGVLALGFLRWVVSGATALKS